MNPPLDESISTLIRELWPREEWTLAKRQEWRARLGNYDTERVKKAIRDSFAETSTAYPKLNDIMVRLRSSNREIAAWQRIDQNAEAEAGKCEYEKAKDRLRSATPSQKMALVSLYKDRVHATLEGEIESWTKNRVMLAAALLDICA